MVADFPASYIGHLSRLVGELRARVEEQEALLRLLEARGINAVAERMLLKVKQHHLREVEAELFLAERLARQGSSGRQGDE